jgi:hypothetical protein
MSTSRSLTFDDSPAFDPPAAPRGLSGRAWRLALALPLLDAGTVLVVATLLAYSAFFTFYYPLYFQ